jgi:hypothetical protein
MKYAWPDTHSVVTYIGAIALTSFIFVHPSGWALYDIAGSFALLNGGQTIGNLGKGKQREIQGGSVAPDTINPPAALSKESPVPLA